MTARPTLVNLDLRPSQSVSQSMLWLSNLYYDFDEVTLRYGHLEKLASWLASRQVQMATYIAS